MDAGGFVSVWRTTIFVKNLLKINCILWISTMFLIWECCSTTRLNASAEPCVKRSDRYFERRIHNFALRFHENLEKQRIRQKRFVLPTSEETTYNVPVVLKSDPKIIHVQNFGPVIAWCCSNSNLQNLFAATKNGTILFMDSTLVPFYIFHTNESIHELQAFKHKDRLWLIFLQQNSYGEFFLQVYEYHESTRNMKKNQRIIVYGETVVFSVITIQNLVYLSFASNENMRSTLNLHVWKDTMFDEISTLVLHGTCSSLAMWDVGNTILIATSIADKSLSSIIKYNSMKEKLTWMQPIEIANPIAVKSFKVSGSLYLLYTTVKSAHIFWWNGFNFIQWQKILPDFDSKVITSVSTLKLLDQELLAISSDDRLQYYVQDSSSHYINVGTTYFPEATYLQKFLLSNKGNFYYALPVFKNGSYPILVFELRFTSQVLSSRIHSDSLISCLNDVSSSLQEKQQVMNAVSNNLDRIWMRNETKPVLSEINVDGSINADKVVNINVVEVTSEAVPNMMPLNIYKFVDEFSSQLTLLTSNIATTVSKSANAIVNSNLNFLKPVSMIMGHIGKVSIPVIVNDIKVARPHNLLTTLGEQSFKNPATVANIVTEAATISGTLNTKSMEGFVLLDGRQVINGLVSLQNTHGNNIILNSNILNNVDLSYMVKNSQVQNIVGQKYFKKLLASDISSSNNINNLNITEVIDQIVPVNSEHIERPINFGSEVFITGDLLTQSFIGLVNLPKLADNSVKKYGLEEINGSKIFLQPLKIEKDINVQGATNNINLEHIFTLHTTQDITGNFSLIGNTLFRNNIFTESINGIDLMKDAVTQHGRNDIQNHIFFMQSLSVFNIEMSDGSTIESFDPSEEASQILTADNAVFYGTHTMKHVIIQNDINIESNNTGFPLFDVLNKVWLKSKKQVIDLARFGNLKITELQVDTINNISIETDLVPLSENGLISSFKIFKDNITVNSMLFNPGILLNGVDISSLKVWLSVGDKKILRNVTTKSIIVEGDMTMSGMINNMPLSDFMLSQENQICKGKKSLELGSFHSFRTSDLSFDFFNNVNFALFAATAVILKPSMFLHNKWFKEIKGNELHINGALNGHAFEEMVKRIVTVDSFQDIRFKTFNDHLKAETILTRFLSGVEFSDLEKNIVLRDQEQKILSSKLFTKKIWSNSLSVQEKISDINITNLWKSAFSKKAHNYIPHHITFLGPIKVQHIYIKNAAIDGVDPKFFIGLDKELNLNEVIFENIQVMNIEVVGLINGCNLTSTISNAMWRKGEEQYINDFKFFNVLKVIGNLHAKCSINGISLDYLNTSVIPLLSNRIIPGNFFFKNVTVLNLNTLMFSNDLDLKLLISDAVMHNGFQVIRGKKEFSGLTLGNTLIDFLNVRQSLCDSGILLFNTSVMKHTVQKLPAHTFPDVVSNNVVLKGNLNGVKIPKDLVLADTPEIIHSQTIINGTLSLISDLRVFGKIDNVQLFLFLHERVTLLGKEKFNTSLILLQDSIFKNEATIRGHINNIRINKIVKTLGNQTLSGQKTFQDLVGNNIDIQKHINYINLTELYESLLKINKDERLLNMVLFAGIRASTLFVSGDVSNTSLFDLWDAMHDKAVKVSNILDSFTNKLSYGDLLFDFKDARDHLVSTYGYFEQHQFLNINNTKRFLPIFEPPSIGEDYELPVSDMIIWVAEDELCKTGLQCCDGVYSYKMNVLHNGTLTHQEDIAGKVFQYNLKLQQEDVVGFLVQAYRRCDDNVSLIDIETLHYANSKSRNTLAPLLNSTLLEAKIIEVDEEIFIIIAYNFKGPGEKVYIYRYEVLHDSWLFHKKYYPWNPTSIDVVAVKESEKEQIFLAVTGYSSTPGLTIYAWLNGENTFTFIQSVSTSVPGTAKWISHRGNLFLLLAKEKSKEQKENSWVEVYTEPIEVYSFSDALELSHTVNVQGIHTLETFKFADETYVLAASRHLQTIYVIQWRGYNGFEVIQELPAPGVERLAVYTASNSELMLAIASVTGHTKVLKAAFRGPVKYLD